MSENCTHDCSTCSSACASRTAPQDLHEKPNEYTHVKKVIGVVSGKGGVGKSLVTSLLAVLTARQGYQTAILDADMTGPSIPRAFGIHEQALSSEIGILPARSKTGIRIMSLNLLLENETDPVVWRGPVIAGAVKQFWTDVAWGDVDFMFVDMPPGTGDVPLTVFQSLPVDGIVVVATPQQLVGMIVEKAVNMATMMNIPVLALVENMSSFRCPDCGSVHAIFGESRADDIAKAHGISPVCRLPIDPKLAAAVDAGAIELCEENALDTMVKKLADMLL
ncbi:MAG: Mrp/NBP35 family ATP-binding protein [Clostridia bacterium]|nr:Mrp/NBP35 family ATP-binding protein [Clostridia bacterium]MBR6299741.1 Mrp/NBP35 family ATP-binding protein [Clostridia bacterium]